MYEKNFFFYTYLALKKVRQTFTGFFNQQWWRQRPNLSNENRFFGIPLPLLFKLYTLQIWFKGGDL